MSDYCDFLQGVCVLQTALSDHVLNNKFINPELIELSQATGGVKVIPYDAQADETARAMVILQRGDITLQNKGILSQPSSQSTFTPQLSLMIQVSTQSYYFTEKLGQEILQYVASIQGALRSFNLNIASLSLSPTRNDKTNSPNYFINAVTITGSIPITVWKIQSSEDILSSIKMNIKFSGQKIIP
jgi:hypothetical protein